MKSIGWSLLFTLFIGVLLYLNPSSRMGWFCFGWCCAFVVAGVIVHVFHKMEMRELDRLNQAIKNDLDRRIEEILNAQKD